MRRVRDRHHRRGDHQPRDHRHARGRNQVPVAAVEVPHERRGAEQQQLEEDAEDPTGDGKAAGAAGGGVRPGAAVEDALQVGVRLRLRVTWRPISAAAAVKDCCIHGARRMRS